MKSHPQVMKELLAEHAAKMGTTERVAEFIATVETCCDWSLFDTPDSMYRNFDENFGKCECGGCFGRCEESSR